MADLPKSNFLLDRLLRDLKLDQLPEPKRSEVLRAIAEVAERRILQTVLMNMDEAALKEFEEKLRSGMTEQQAAQFLMERVPGLTAKVEQTLMDLRQRLITDINQIDQELAAQIQPPPTRQTPPAQQ